MDDAGELELRYLAGQRRAWLEILRLCLRELGIYDDPVVGSARWVLERQETLQTLRRICTHFGDNDWPDTLYIPDILSNHVSPYLTRDAS
jgi:hypothetical protein